MSLPELFTSAGTLFAGIGALAAWRNSRQTRKQTQPSNGTRLAEYVERMDARIAHIDSRVTSMDRLMVYHVTDPQAHESN